MTTLERIKSPVAAELARYEEYLRETMRSEGNLTQQMLDHVMGTRGKGMRPLMVFLTAAMHGGADHGYLPAMLVEMLHCATLVHDDVIDHSDLRRGMPSVDALWDSRRAVLLGDFILARSFGLGMESGQYDVVAYITRCMTQLCEGELLQSEMSDSLATTREVYNEIIYKKTATLIGTSCGAGAMAAGAAPAETALLKRIGDDAGMAFQIKDDILDFSAATGKPRGGDLRERKITLPLLMIMETRREEVLGLLRRGDTEALCALVENGGGLEMAAVAMQEYIDRAVALLRDNFAPSPYRDSLEQLFGFIAEREK